MPAKNTKITALVLKRIARRLWSSEGMDAEELFVNDLASVSRLHPLSGLDRSDEEGLSRRESLFRSETTLC